MLKPNKEGSQWVLKWRSFGSKEITQEIPDSVILSLSWAVIEILKQNWNNPEWADWYQRTDNIIYTMMKYRETFPVAKHALSTSCSDDKYVVNRRSVRSMEITPNMNIPDSVYLQRKLLACYDRRFFFFFFLNKDKTLLFPLQVSLSLTCIYPLCDIF